MCIIIIAKIGRFYLIPGLFDQQTLVAVFVQGRKWLDFRFFSKSGAQCAEIRKPPTNRKNSNFSRKYVQGDTFYPLFTHPIGQENYRFYSWLCVSWFSEGVIVEKSTYFELLNFTRGKSTSNSWIFRVYFRQIHEKGKAGNKTHSFPDVLSR